MIAIDGFAYSSKIRYIDPKVKMITALVPLILCISFDGFLVSGFTILVMGVLTIKYSGVSLKIFYKYMTIPVVFLVLGVIAVMVGRFPKNVNLILGFNAGNYAYGISRVTLLLGLKLALRSFGCLSCLYFFSFNTPMTDIFSFFEKTPIPRVIVSLGELIYRYIFVLLSEAGNINVAQKSRLGYGSFKSSINCAAMLAGSLFIRSYARVDRAYNALESRNFDGGSFSVWKETYEKGGKFYLFTIIFAIILIIMWICEKFLVNE